MRKTFLLFLAFVAAFCTCAQCPAESGAEETQADILTAGFYVGEDGYLELYENGYANLNAGGYDFPVTWDEKNICSETGSVGRYTYRNGHLSFGWEGGDGYYTYEYDYSPEGNPEAALQSVLAEEDSGFFDVIGEEPFFVYHKDGKNYGYEMDFWEGCSVWCAVRDCKITARASSFLAPQGRYSYEPSNICSSDRDSAWIEGAEGYGIGESVEITRRYTVADEEYGVDFRGLCVVNGYARTSERWQANSRVKQLSMYFNDVYVDTLNLKDTMEPQYFDLEKYQLHADSGADSVFRFVIRSVYPGEQYEDTAITGIEVDFWTPNH